MERGQVSTEYLIILAVVIIIALIVIGVMGGIPGIAGSATNRVSEGDWSSQPIGIESYVVDTNGDYALAVKNNQRNSAQITLLNVSSGSAGSLTTTIEMGDTLIIRSITPLVLVDRCKEGEKYSYPVDIQYVDVVSGATMQINGENHNMPLTGTCAENA